MICSDTSFFTCMEKIVADSGTDGILDYIAEYYPKEFLAYVEKNMMEIYAGAREESGLY